MPTTVAARMCKPLLEVDRAQTELLLARYGLTQAELDAPAARAPYDFLVALLELARNVTHNERLGLYGAQMEGGTLEVLEFMSRSSATVLDALQRMSRYQRLLHEPCDCKVLQQGGGAMVSIGAKDGLRLPAMIVDFFMASLFLALQRLHLPLTGSEVFLAHAEPAGAHEYAALFQVPVHFAARGDYAFFPEALLQQRLPGADPVLCALLEQRAQRLIATLPEGAHFSGRVQNQLSHELRGGEPSQKRVASALGVSTRTLRRRLSEEGTSFNGELDKLRRELALTLLRDHPLQAEEAAFVLGFSEASAFRRAWRRWTGQTFVVSRQVMQASS
jgi:AraC-like DNA-binding protein